MDKEIVRNSMVFFESFYSSADELDDHEFRLAWKAICEYAFYNIEPENMPLSVKIFFKLIKPNIDSVIRQRAGGNSGGRPKKPRVTNSKTQGYESENPRLLNEKPRVTEPETPLIYDVDVDKDVDVDGDVDVVADVEQPASDGGRTTTDTTPAQITNTSSEYGEIPTVAQIAFEFAKHKYKPEPTEMERFVRYNREHKWKLPLDEAVTRWIANEKKRENKKKDHGFDEHDYDFDEIDRKLMLVNQREAEEYEQRNMDQPVGSAG